MSQPIAILSVYDKAGLLPLVEGLAQQGVRILGSGGTAKAIRNANMKVESVHHPLTELTGHLSRQERRQQRARETRAGCGVGREQGREIVLSQQRDETQDER
jgi:hypothetical protein